MAPKAPVVKQENVADHATTRSASTPGNVGLGAAGTFYKHPTLVIGTVVRAGGGAYDVEVSVLTTQQTVICTVAGSTAATLIGVSSCEIPPEGSQVIVLMANRNSHSGVIIASYPDADRGVVDAVQDSLNDLIDVEGGVNKYNVSAYRVPQADASYTSTVNASAQRYLDLVPGNKSWANEQGVAVSILNLLLLLKATDRARLEFGVLDDLVRLVSGYFQHISAKGTEQIYNDGGFITHELGVSIYQWEHSGFLKLGTPAYTKSTDTQAMEAGTATLYAPTGGEPSVPRKRMQVFTGYLGDIMNMFVANPDPDMAIDTVSKKAIDQGLLHTHVDTSGRLTVRSAAGISFQRADRIPVPKRLKEPWDPEGNKVEDEAGEVNTTRPAYKFPSPYSRSMLMRDANAYRNAQAYSKLAALDKDFYIPEETDMSEPNDEYDATAKGSEPFKADKNKQASFNLEDDGSIIIRDAWGSEIIMRGGNIIITCAGQLELRPGKSIVALAGDDAIIKARNSVDITATNKDVRIKAEANMQLVSEGRTGGGGILLESKSKSNSVQYTGVTGEAVRSSGIVLKANDATVLTTGKRVHLAASEHFLIDGLDKDNVPQARMYMGLKEFVCATSKYVNISAGGTAGVLVMPSMALVSGRVAGVVAEDQAVITEGLKALRGTEVDMKNDPYTETLEPRFRKIKERLLDKSDWVGAYTPTIRAGIAFTYRSTAEYGTTKATEIDAAGATFQVYQAAWAHMAKSKSPFVPATLTGWTEYAINETYAWPGETAYEGNDAYVKVDAEKYIGDAALGVAKKRSEVLAGAGAAGAVSKLGFNEYEVVK